MNALYLTVFASLLLAGLGLLLFFHSSSQRDRDHVDRLALLPLDDSDDFKVPVTPATPAPAANSTAPPAPPAKRDDNPLNEGDPDVR